MPPAGTRIAHALGRRRGVPMRHLLKIVPLLPGLVWWAVELAAQERSMTAAVPYVGAEVCRVCHEAQHAAWAATKHARALERLSGAERAGNRCIRCHVTDSPELVAAEGDRPGLPGVQCEACHGPGRAHAETARSGAVRPGAIVRTPSEQTCTRCHNSESPHYKPFFYGAMKGFVHRVPR